MAPSILYFLLNVLDEDGGDACFFEDINFQQEMDAAATEYKRIPYVLIVSATANHTRLLVGIKEEGGLSHAEAWSLLNSLIALAIDEDFTENPLANLKISYQRVADAELMHYHGVTPERGEPIHCPPLSKEDDAYMARMLKRGATENGALRAVRAKQAWEKAEAEMSSR